MEHRAVLTPAGLDEVLEQCGLADPGVAHDGHDAAAPAAHVVEQLGERVALLVATDQIARPARTRAGVLLDGPKR
jgi:hypothetical protein